MKILVTGATGYIGGRLVPRLLARGHKVRIFVRDPRRIAGRPWLGQVEIATGNIQNYNAVRRALDGIDTAYYLVHSMEAGPDYALLDRMAANLFAAAAKNIRHLIYLGGLLPPGGTASEHLTSRAEVGEILRAACPTTEFRAGPIIGSGSASFELVRYLTDHFYRCDSGMVYINDFYPAGIIFIEIIFQFCKNGCLTVSGIIRYQKRPALLRKNRILEPHETLGMLTRKIEHFRIGR